MKMWLAVASSAMVFFLVRAEEQVWDDNGADNVWSTNAANWAGAALWTNGNDAVFSGAGGTLAGEAVDVASTVTVATVTFQTNGYVVADADDDGSLSLVGAGEIWVPNAGDTGTVSEAVAGSVGLTKKGDGMLCLTTNNAFTGTTTVQAGVLRLSRGMLYALGAVGAGNDTVVANGATLDFNGAYVNSGSSEKFTVSGAGVDGKGVLINTGSGHVNKSIGAVTLLDDTTIGGANRIDAYTIYQNTHTLTKVGTGQLCVQNVSTGAIVISSGQYTLLANANGLGGSTPGDTIVNGGNLDSWNSMTVPERITFNGGTVSQGNPNLQQFTLTGYLTLNSNITFNTSSPTSGVEVAGYIDGSGGFTQGNAGWLYITGDTNAYTGPTIINSGRTIFVGKTNLFSGVLGEGTVTNYGTLNGYSSRITKGNIVSSGTINVYTGSLGAASTVSSGNLYLRGGELGTGTVVNTGNIVCYSPVTGSGAVTNSGNIWFDYLERTVCSNSVMGSGYVYQRYGGEVAMSGAYSSNGVLRVGNGAFTLEEGAEYNVYSDMSVADRQNVGFSYVPTNITAVVNVNSGCVLRVKCMTFGNGTNFVVGGIMTGILNQVGGLVHTTGAAAEGNGVRLGHYPQTQSFYNMMGGTLIVAADYDLGCATDGQGWFNMTGGEVYTKRVMLNERDSTGGFGRLTVSGGVLNVGSLTGSDMAISNAICADLYAPYLVELGGAGGTIRAVTNLWIPASATLFGSNENAITFDSREWTISMTNRLSGAGGFNKTGSGALALSGSNAFEGDVRILEGSVSLDAADALPDGAKVLFAVSNAGQGGFLSAPGSFALQGLKVGVANPQDLDTSKTYTVMTCDGGGVISGTYSVDPDNLPGPWYLTRSVAYDRLELRAAIGTLILMH